MTDLTHEEFRQLAPLYVVYALEVEERALFEEHLKTCDECAAEVRSLRPVALSIALAAPQVDPPAALRERILSSVSNGGARVADPETPPVVPPAEPTATAVRSRFAWMSAAAAAVLAIGLGAYAASLRSTVTEMQSQLDDALGRLSRSEAQLAAASQAAAGVQARLAVLTAPDVLQVALTGQPPSPRAIGRAFVSRSRGTMFAAQDLPPLQVGRTYQLWFLTSGAPVSAGIFKPDPAGRVLLTAAQPPPDVTPTGLAVSLEPDGGVPAPTGTLYLVGQATQ